MWEDIGDLSDWDLVERCWQGDNRAWEVLLDRHAESLSRSIRRLLGNEWFDRHLVEDIAQKVWLALLQKDYDRLHRYRQKRSCFNTYLREVARQVIELGHRPKGGRKGRDVPLEGHDRADPAGDDALVQAELAEYKESLTRQQKRCLNEKLLGNPKQAAEPPITGDNERQLKHRMEQKWDEHLGSG